MADRNVLIKEDTQQELRVAKIKFLKTSKSKPTNNNVIHTALKEYNQ